MERYAVIHTVMPREFVLLQGQGCKWKQCTFCDYHTDSSADAYSVNKQALDHVTGIYGVLDIINSGSAMELDRQTIELIQRVVKDKKIHTLWLEAHYMYRKQLQQFAEQFEGVCVKYRCGIESFDGTLRLAWNKGVPVNVQAEDVAKYFQGVCLMCCTQGEERQRILDDIDTAEKWFEYASVNIFCNNSTSIQRDEELVKWFMEEVYPKLKDSKKIEILINNTDLGVG